MKKNNEQKKKIFDGRFMVGIVVQYINDKDLSPLAQYIALAIARQSFGYRKRYAYIKQDVFLAQISKPTFFKYRDVLVQEGLLEWKKTKGYTMYKLLEPKNEIDSFVFSSKPIEEVTTNPEDDDEWNIWTQEVINGSKNN